MTEIKREINIGILGPGNIARRFAEAALMCKGAKLLATGSRDLQKAQDFAETYGIERSYGSYRELMEDPDVQLIYIATLHNNHVELAIDCLNHGKGVLCEKPFALTEESALKATKLAKEKNLFFMEAMWTRFLPTVRQAHRWIQQGRIGELRMIDASFCCYSAEIDPKSRLFDPALAGGTLYDVGVYPLALAMDFAASPIAEMQSVSKFCCTGVDEFEMLSLRFENNIFASISAGSRVATEQRAMLYGTAGYIELPQFWGGTKARLFNSSGVLAEEFESDYSSTYEGFKFEIQHSLDLMFMDETESPIMPHKDTVAVAAVFDEFFKDKSYGKAQ